MLMFVYFLLCFLLVVKRESKILFNVSLFFLLLLFCFCGQVADRENYELWFDISEYSILSNLGFYILTKLLIFIGWNVQGLYIIIGAVYLFTLSYFIRKFSINPNYVLAYYMLGLFFLDVVQLKNTMGHIFILWALYFYLISDKVRKKNLVYLIFVLLATLIHPSLIFYSIFIFLKSKSKNVILYSILAIIILQNFIYLILNHAALFLGEKSLVNEGFYSDKMILLTQLILILFFFISAFLFMRHKKYMRLISWESFSLLLNMLFLMTTLIPLLQVSIDFRRFFFFLSIIVVILFGRCLPKSCSLVYRGLFVCYSLINLYFFSLSGNYQTVFLPIFKNNILLNIF